MKIWQFGVILVFASILLSIVIYEDAKTTNFLPWMVIMIDIIMFFFGLILVKWGKK